MTGLRSQRSMKRGSTPNLAGTQLRLFSREAITLKTTDLMSDRARIKHGIPKAAVTPVVTRARHLVGASMTESNWQRLRRTEERLWLFRPSEALSHIAVQTYLSRCPASGGCNHKAYKVKTRNCWYQVPLPPANDAFITGMSTTGPWICLNRFKKLTATNTLYVIEFLRTMTLQEKAAIGLALLTQAVRTQLRPRCYASGLTKWEPGDIEKLLVPYPLPAKGSYSIYKRAIAALLAGKQREASAIADAFLGEWSSTEQPNCSSITRR
jgi:adenine-specific DNA-methyltransferase